MGVVEVRDFQIWDNHIHGNDPLGGTTMMRLESVLTATDPKASGRAARNTGAVFLCLRTAIH